MTSQSLTVLSWMLVLLSTLIRNIEDGVNKRN